MTAAALVGFVCLAVINNPPERPLFNGLLHIMSLALLVLAFIGRIWAALYLVGRKSKVLCIEGPFSISRNPLYLFSFLGAIGIGLLTESFVLTAILAIAYLMFYFFIIRDEERRLDGLFGTGFAEYRSRVPRFFPLKPWRHCRGTEVTVQIRPFIQSMIDSSVLLWAYCLVTLADTLMGGQMLDLPPNLLHFP